MKSDSEPAPAPGEITEMTDLVFDLEGSVLAENYPFALWEEVVRILPWLNDAENVGILPLRGSLSDTNTLLSRRSKLVLRISGEDIAKAARLSGQLLMIGTNPLKVGKSKPRALQPASTLHAHMVESNLDEVAFLAAMKDELQSMNIACNLICDKQRKVAGDKQTLRGFGLVLHDLKPTASLHIQRAGLGGARHYGCGLFVPFKAITGLD